MYFVFVVRQSLWDDKMTNDKIIKYFENSYVRLTLYELKRYFATENLTIKKLSERLALFW